MLLVFKRCFIWGSRSPRTNTLVVITLLCRLNQRRYVSCSRTQPVDWTTLVRVLLKDTTCRLNQRWYASCSMTQPLDTLDWTNAGTCLYQGHNLSTEPTLVRVLLKDTTCQHNQFNQRRYLSCSRTQPVDTVDIITAGTCLTQGRNLSTEPTLIRILLNDATSRHARLNQRRYVSLSRTQPVDWANAGTCLTQGHNLSTQSI